MVRVFIRDEDECGHDNVSAQKSVNTFKIPILFGRTLELATLDNAWVDSRTHLVSLYAPIGMGKSVLISRWLHSLQQKQWHDAEMVYVWSFYPPDLTSPLFNPVDEFFRHALKWFGDAEPEQHNPLAQGKRLAELVQQHHCLLILDGLELLQTHSGGMQGHITDIRLHSLLTELAQYNPGLCVTVSRYPLTENFYSESVEHMKLDKLAVDSCIQLLRYKGIQASEGRLQQIAEDFDQNPLALQLLGSYLNVWHGGDWQQMEHIPVLLDEDPEGRQIRRLLTANATQLAFTAGESLLYLLSLLQQPLCIHTLEVLLARIPRHWWTRWFKKQDRYADIMWPLLQLNVQQRQQTIRQLQTLGLITAFGSCLSVHPWIRQFFKRAFQQDWPLAWRQANQSLLQYHQTLAVVSPASNHTTTVVPWHTPANGIINMPRQSVAVAKARLEHVLDEMDTPVRVSAATPTPLDQQPQEPLVIPSGEAIPEPSILANASTLPELEGETPLAVAVEPAIPESNSSAESSLVTDEINVPVSSEGEATLDDPTCTSSDTIPVSVGTLEVSPSELPAKDNEVSMVLTAKEVEMLQDLIPQLHQFQRSLQILQQRTKKFQKSLRQLDKDVQSMHYPFAYTGIDR